jgi:glycosyltransferase involved in cell wall biosynthesis
MAKSIVYITPVVVPSSSAASKRILSNAKLFSELGYNTYVFSGSEVSESFLLKDLTITPTGIGIQNSKGFSKMKGYKKSVRFAIQKLEELDTSNIEAIIIYSGYSFYLSPLLKWTRKNKVSLVFDAVEWYTPPAVYHWFVNPYYWNTEYGMRYLIPKTKNVIAISSFLNDYYTKKKCNTIVLPPLYATQPKLENPSTDQITLSYSGSPGKKDHLNNILEAIVQFNNENEIIIHFDVVGISEGQALKYNAFAKDGLKSLPEFIKAHGYVAMEKAQEVVGKSTFSILFREKNKTNTAGFPTKVVESLSLGTPVVLNLTSDLHKYLIHKKNGLVIHDFKVESIKAMLSEIVKMSNEELQTMRKNASEMAQENFYFTSRKEQVKSFLKKLR